MVVGLCLVPDIQECVNVFKHSGVTKGYCFGFWDVKENLVPIATVCQVLCAATVECEAWPKTCESLSSKFGRKLSIIGRCESTDKLEKVNHLQAHLEGSGGPGSSQVVLFLNAAIVTHNVLSSPKSNTVVATTSKKEIESNPKRLERKSQTRHRSRSRTRRRAVTERGEIQHSSVQLTTMSFKYSSSYAHSSGRIPHLITIAQQVSQVFSSLSPTTRNNRSTISQIRWWEIVALIICMQLFPFGFAVQVLDRFLTAKFGALRVFLVTYSVTLGQLFHRSRSIVGITGRLCSSISKKYSGIEELDELEATASTELRNASIALIVDYALGAACAVTLALGRREVANISYNYIGYALQSSTVRNTVQFIMAQHAPLGFKLNSRLDTVLGTMVLMVVDTWHMVTAPLALYASGILLIIAWIVLLGFCGLSTFLGIAHDVVSFLTLHVMLLHSILSNIHGGLVRLLIIMFRLLLGKKYNILRERVDTGNYTFPQLLLGSMLFTIAGFLLQTTLAYYLMIVTLWSSVQVVQRFLLLLFVLVLTVPPESEGGNEQIESFTESHQNKGFSIKSRKLDDKCMCLLVVPSPEPVSKVLSSWVARAVGDSFTTHGSRVVTALSSIVCGIGYNFRTREEVNAKRMTLFTRGYFGAFKA